MSFAKDGNSDIYTMELDSRIVERITVHSSIDTSPSFSPDGKFIAFNSDRSGLQQIYVMRSDGSNVKRITFGKGIYGTPVWSPRGDLIAFTKMHKENFYWSNENRWNRRKIINGKLLSRSTIMVS